MAAPVILFTQCLQNDFVRPLTAGERLPNLLHIGHAEARRLVGEDPREGPLGRFLAAFEGTAARSGRHAAVHIRDWHDAADPAQQAHLAHFGAHCLKDTDGAKFIGPLEAAIAGPGGESIIDSPGLTDFEGTRLATLARNLMGGADPAAVKVGIIGVWTDVKVNYLAYELQTRLGLTRIGVCSALVASRSRARHRAALGHLAEMLGVEVLDSVPEFLAWLEVDAAGAAPAARKAGFGTEVAVRAGDPALGDEERALVAYLFRDAKRVELARLGGGFSGSKVFRTRSEDRDGRAEVPYVVKVDVHAKIAKERVAVESVESLLGGASPVMADWVDLETLGAIKYGFASLHRSETRTLLSRLRAADGPAEVRRVMDGALRVLALLHQAPRPERVQLFQHFTYKPEYAGNTLKRAAAVAGSADDPDVRALETFYARLPELLAEDPGEVAVAMIHGDLNLANLLQDDIGNTWMIDYFWTGLGPLLKDVAKLENDLRYIAYPIGDATGRREAALDALREHLERLLGGPVDPRAYAVALLRYAAHSLSFDECDAAQKRAALADAARHARTILGAPRVVRIASVGFRE